MTISVGLIGYGMAGSVFHAPLIKSVDGLTLSAIVSSSPEKVHRDYPDMPVLPTLDALLENNEIQLIVIATTNESHYTLAKRALEAGNHLFVYNPFVISTSHSDELIALSLQQHFFLSFFHIRSWDNY